jgi:sugar/nucleoside kinase (ribokinase family)
MPAYDIITIGESLRDVFYFIHDATLSCTVNKETCLLCLEYADKIPVQKVVKVPAAGNSSNAAVGARRLGLKSAFVTWIGNDHAGRHMQEALEDEGVDLTYVMLDLKHATNESTVINFQGERTQLVYFQPRTYKLPKLAKTRCIYYSAMGEKPASFDRALQAELKRRKDVFFAFQPGTTHIRSGLKALKPLIARSDLFILNKDEAHVLLGNGDRHMCNLLAAFAHHGAKNVIITDGKNGADAWDGKEHWHMPIFDGEAKERTGAGDSFATAVTVALLNGSTIPEALRWGTANSWSVVQHIGPQTGLLDKRSMQRVLKKFTHTKPTLHKH